MAPPPTVVVSHITPIYLHFYVAVIFLCLSTPECNKPPQRSESKEAFEMSSVVHNSQVLTFLSKKQMPENYLVQDGTLEWDAA